MESVINSISTLPAVVLSATSQGLNTVNNYTLRPIFDGICAGTSLATDSLNIVIIKPVTILAQGVASVATFVDPYVFGTAIVAGTGLVAKGVYDLNSKGVRDKSVAKKLIAGGLTGIACGTMRFAISYFSKSDVILDDKKTSDSHIITGGMGSLVIITIALIALRVKLALADRKHINDDFQPFRY